MSVITELNIIDPNIKPGRKIDAVSLDMPNHRLHCFGTLVSEMVFATLEGDSNNTSATMTPSEVRDHWQMWNAIKLEWDFAKKHNDGPLTPLEQTKKFLIPAPKEIQLINNRKCKRVALELIRMLEVSAGTDSAGSQTHIGLGSQAQIEKQMQYCEDAMNHYWGKGKDESDVGVFIPEYKQLGTLIPDIDVDFAQYQEASADGTDTGFKDVPDVASKGTN